jgi:hypothetical protein
MLSRGYRARLHSVIQLAQEHGVDLVCEVNPSANWVSFQFDGIDATSVALRLDEAMALSTTELLSHVYQGLGVPIDPATTDVSEGSSPRPQAPINELDPKVFRRHEISLLEILAWELEQGRRNPHGQGAGARNVGKFVASETSRL